METYQLFIMRHAQAVAGEYGADFQRSLTSHGQLQAQAIGNWLAKREERPQHIFASSAHRARQTAELVSDQLSPAPSLSVQANLYQVTVLELIRLVTQQTEKNRSLMLIGHNPTLEDFLYGLVDVPAGQTLKLQPGSVAIIDIQSVWSQLSRANCRLLQLIHANDLL